MSEMVQGVALAKASMGVRFPPADSVSRYFVRGVWTNGQSLGSQTLLSRFDSGYSLYTTQIFKSAGALVEMVHPYPIYPTV